MSVLVLDDKPPLSPRSSVVEKLDNEKQVYAVPVAEFDDPNIDFDAVGLEDDSPYPEVRSAVANTDDPDMPVNTIRAWCIGLCWSMILPGMNQFFFFRYPSITVTGVVAQLLSFPVGRLWARLMPRVKFFGASLNPGPFTVKEHVLITIMATVGYSSAYATDIIAVQRVYYNQTYNFSYQWMLVMSTQLIGFSIGGICRRYLVQPPSMIWPSNLVTCALFNTLHSQQYVGIGNRAGLSRERFFAYAFTVSFCWYFFPGYIFQALSYFSWVCWIAPNNIVVNQLFGYESGLGMSLITFDWNQIIAYNGSPLATPWWAEANVAFGFVFFFWFITPILYYTNTWYGKYMPMSSRTSYDNQGQAYDISRIINSDGGTFNQTGYEHYSPLFLSTTFAMSYGLSFASITSTIVHTVLYFRRQIWVQSRRSLSEQPDIHARLMNRYPQVPEWWYGTILVSMFAFAVISIEAWDTEFPVWGLILALLLSFVYTVPCGMIQAITNQQIALNVIAELIIGYALPGKPIAMMMFKTWGYYSMFQALQFTSDMKLCHYMKVPPRVMFWAQVIATAVAGTVQLAVQSWMFTNIPDICSPDQKDGFTCPSTQVFGTASFIWGVIGPARQFSKGQIYYGLVFFFIVGAVCPLVSYAISLKWPNSIFKYVNFPVIFNGSQWIPPASALNYVPWTIVGFIFNYVIRRRHFSWWTKYNYILSAAMDSGVAIAVLIIYFTLQYPANGTIGESTIQSWWGNTVYKNTLDANMTTYYKLFGNQTFGPKQPW
ncbi:OPT oligopeptide transporter protein-domain-containing protein [Rhodofomes roseus]|uniref:OPT oligopeptide transporter protein-domain-containing protein n=1 Tax=Rhodofomes roseus TaxID=34475 RepID=A0ABQ8KQ48_9APHY|nr:OPT oligopeptide transporter protein-domain-containing protein [Rhodofomes roseus]KAH9840538.1 OPT oligopeptide transporter protein-domain-containing protein [Rhodofomes roseus]